MAPGPAAQLILAVSPEGALGKAGVLVAVGVKVGLGVLFFGIGHFLGSRHRLDHSCSCLGSSINHFPASVTFLLSGIDADGLYIPEIDARWVTRIKVSIPMIMRLGAWRSVS